MLVSLTTRWVLLVRLVILTLLGALMLRIAWMSDDSLITLRTVLNITHNWGPGYNATEVVQAYTHPLWFLVWVAMGAFTNQWVVGLMLLSVALSLSAVAVVLWRTTSVARLVVMAALLAFSNAFMDFTSGGLENPLSYLGVSLLLVLTLRSRWNPLVAGLVGLTAAAVVLTRFDLALLILPALVVLAWRRRRQWQLLLGGAGGFVLPLVVWLLWSKLTYDAWLPNTFEAKRNVNIPATELIVQGVRYLWVSFEHDPVSLIALSVGVVASLLFGPVMLRAWSAGVFIYLGYVVWIGGDFMAGRFIAVPVLVSIMLLALVSSGDRTDRLHKSIDPARVGAAIGVTMLLLIGSWITGAGPGALTTVQGPRWEVDQNLNAGVGDARGTSTAGGMTLRQWANNLSLAYVNPDIVPIGDGTGLARTMREIDKAAQNWPTSGGDFIYPSEVGEFCGFLGNIGIATGPITHLIDNCALTDRFLAGQPFGPTEPFAWKAGHFHRAVPEGYVEAIMTNDPSKLTDMGLQFELRELWSRIR